jgi:hypothetical protein
MRYGVIAEAVCDESRAISLKSFVLVLRLYVDVCSRCANVFNTVCQVDTMGGEPCFSQALDSQNNR